MEVRARDEAEPFTTADGSIIRSLLDRSNAPVAAWETTVTEYVVPGLRPEIVHSVARLEQVTPSGVVVAV